MHLHALTMQRGMLSAPPTTPQHQIKHGMLQYGLEGAARISPEPPPRSTLLANARNMQVRDPSALYARTSTVASYSSMPDRLAYSSSSASIVNENSAMPRDTFRSLQAEHQRTQDDNMKTVLSMRRVLADITVSSEQRVTKLMQQVATLQEEKQALQIGKSEIEEAHARAKEAERLAGTVTQLKNSILTLEDSHGKLHEKLARSNNTLEERDRSLQNLNSTVRERGATMERLQQELAQQNDSLETAKKLIASLEESKKNDATELKTEIKEKDELIQKLEDFLHIDDELDSPDDEEQCIPILKTKLAQLRYAISQREEENLELEDKLTEQTEALQELIDEDQRAIQELQKQLTEKEADSKKMRDELMKKEETLKEVENRLETINEDKKEEVERLFKEKDETLGRLEKSSSHANSLLRELRTSFEVEMEQKDLELRDLRKRNLAIARELEELQRQTERGPMGMLVGQTADAVDNLFRCSGESEFRDNLGVKDESWINYWKRRG